MTTIETHRLVLRPLVAEDARAYAAIRVEPGVARFLPPLGPWRIAPNRLARAYIEEFTRDWRRAGYAPWAMVERQAGRLVGVCGLLHRVERDEAELSFMVASRHWRQGYAREAATAALGHAFGPLGLGRVVAIVRPDNAASLALLAGLGFRPDGEERYAGGRVLRLVIEPLA